MIQPWLRIVKSIEISYLPVAVNHSCSLGYSSTGFLVLFLSSRDQYTSVLPKEGEYELLAVNLAFHIQL